MPEVYPWDYIDSVAGDVKVERIEVRYPKPVLTTDEFDTWRREERDGRIWGVSRDGGEVA